jgi:1,4-dihydroxy-2-naphthoate octaprenyltransferase
MNSLLNSVDPQLVLLIAAIAVVILVSQLFFRILSVGLVPILGLVAIFAGLQYLFGISPKQVWFEVSHLPQMAMKLFNSWA